MMSLMLLQVANVFYTAFARENVVVASNGNSET